MPDYSCCTNASVFKGHSTVMAACCFNRMATRSSPAEHRKHKSAARLMLFSVKSAKRSRDPFCLFQCILLWHETLARQAAGDMCSVHLFIFRDIFSPWATRPNAWPGSTALLSMNHYVNKKNEHAGPTPPSSKLCWTRVQTAPSTPPPSP